MGKDQETVEQVSQRFTELDEAARRRAQQRTAEGADAHAAFAHESVLQAMVRVYNN